MKLFRNLTALLLVLAMLFTATGCSQAPAPAETTAATEAVTEPVVETTEEDPQEKLTALYLSALEALGTEAQAFEITYERTVTVAGLSYCESGKQTLNLWKVGTDEFLAKAKETVTYGEDAYSLEWQEIYGNGAVYQTVADSQFVIEMSAEDYLSRCVPVKLLEPELYTLSADETQTTIFFEGATVGESWLVPEDAEVFSASGTATVSEAGKLTGSSYTADYRHGAAEISISYEVNVTEAGREPTLPESTEGYVTLEDASAAYLLEHAYGYLSQAQTLTCSMFSLLASQAAGFYVQDTSEIAVFDQDDAYSIRWENSMNSMDYSTNESYKHNQTETFIDGKYSITTDDGRPETNASITQPIVQSVIESHLLEYIPSCKYISSAEVSYMGSVILIEYTCNEELSEILCADICTALFQDSNALNDMASAYETGTMTYYLALDAYSLLPTAAGMEYEGLHTIYGRKYALTQQVDQAFDLGSLDAYKTVYEEFPPEEEPETPATPLFYHVTGDNGQEMWLFGTIHIGDERTAYLPQEIYDAFHASDALAIECNTEAFSDQLETDEKLQESLSECYYYSDGSTMEDHIDTPDLYEDARKLLKASGNYNPNSPYLKPQIWSSGIENFFLRQGYSLTYEKGVEYRLMELAEAEDMPIREVESSLFQIQMTSNFSEHLQEFLLFSSLASGAESFWTGSQELYELWCAGDEAALTEKLAEEPWALAEEDFETEDLSEEDLQRVQEILADLENINAQLAGLEEEYNKAMSWDRNDHMVEVAKEYLESGDTIFYAVGLAHLLAENGLVNGLRAAGYTVELVSFQ